MNYDDMNIPTDKELAIEVTVTFMSNPHPKQRMAYQREKLAFIDGAKWMRSEIEKRNGLKVDKKQKP